MLGNITVKDHDGSEAQFKCRRVVNETVRIPSNAIFWHSIDIFLEFVTAPPSFVWPSDAVERCINLGEQGSPQQQTVDVQHFGSKAGFRILLDGLAQSISERQSIVRIVLSQTRGYIARSDIVPLRLLDCPLVTTVLGFAKPLQYLDGQFLDIQTLQDVPKAFAVSAGGMLLKTLGPTGHATIASLRAGLDVELRNRLSFPWLSMQEPKRKTLGLVEGTRRLPDRGGSGETLYKAAEALGIDMIVFDNPDHWLNNPIWRHWYKEFVPVLCTEQSDHVFTARIVDAIRAWGGHLDGLVTFCDHYQVPVAAAALQLGLPTHSPEALDNVTDKFKMSISEGRPTYQVSTFEDAARIVSEHHLEYPLIIKPSLMGFQSEGVYRVENLEEIRTGMRTTDIERHGVQFVIERYCDGPEVDANFVLCDGEIVFFEASDELPKGADTNGHHTGSVDTFLELGNIVPSKLPASEIAVVRDSLHQSLLRIGLPDGMYHAEARVENSSMEFTCSNNDVVDLTRRRSAAKGTPSAWLLEVNPRPGGYMVTQAMKHTYGVDYWALGLLFALQDKKRIRQLSHPFGLGPQYWSSMVFIPAAKGGICQSENPCLELLARRPDLSAHVSWYCNYWAKGQRVPDISEGRNAWLAHLNVFSRRSWTHALEIGETVRKEFNCLIT